MSKHGYGPIIYGGPIPRRFKFQENDVVFVDNLNRHGTIVSGERSPGTYGIEPAVYVEFQSGKGLPGDDPIQTVALKNLYPPLEHRGELIPDHVIKFLMEHREEIESFLGSDHPIVKKEKN